MMFFYLKIKDLPDRRITEEIFKKSHPLEEISFAGRKGEEFILPSF